MKRKMVLIIMAVCMIGTLGIGTAQAISYSAIVNATGVGGTSTFINLTDGATTPAFTNRWFILDPAFQKQHLATALTAISTGIRVSVTFNGTTVPPALSTITVCYVGN